MEAAWLELTWQRRNVTYIRILHLFNKKTLVILVSVIILNMFIHTSMDKSFEKYDKRSWKNVSLVINTNVRLKYLGKRLEPQLKYLGVAS